MTHTTIDRVDAMLEDMFKVEGPELIQLSLGDFRKLCWKEDARGEFIANTATMSSKTVIQISKENGPSVLIDPDGHPLRFA
jgi:hypothetical protein